MTRSTDSRRARNSASVRIGGRRRPGVAALAAALLLGLEPGGAAHRGDLVRPGARPGSGPGLGTGARLADVHDGVVVVAGRVRVGTASAGAGGGAGSLRSLRRRQSDSALAGRVAGLGRRRRTRRPGRRPRCRLRRPGRSRSGACGRDRPRRRRRAASRVAALAGARRSRRALRRLRRLRDGRRPRSGRASSLCTSALGGGAAAFVSGGRRSGGSGAWNSTAAARQPPCGGGCRGPSRCRRCCRCRRCRRAALVSGGRLCGGRGDRGGPRAPRRPSWSRCLRGLGRRPWSGPPSLRSAPAGSGSAVAVGPGGRRRWAGRPVGPRPRRRRAGAVGVGSRRPRRRSLPRSGCCSPVVCLAVEHRCSPTPRLRARLASLGTARRCWACGPPVGGPKFVGCRPAV